MPPLLLPAEHGDRRDRVPHSRIPAVADAARAELFPLERAVHTVVFLEHPAEHAPRAL